MDYSTRIQRLESLLPLITSTRSSLPSLVSSLSPSTPSAPPPPHSDLSTLYRLASTQCETSIQSLFERLEALDEILNHAEESYGKDSTRVVPRQVKEEDPWERVGDILGGGTKGATARDKGPFKPTLEAPRTNEQLVDFLKTWETNHSNVRFDLERLQSESRCSHVERVEMRLKGVMRAVIVVRWERLEDSSVAMVELVACSSLKETVSILLYRLRYTRALLTRP